MVAAGVMLNVITVQFVLTIPDHMSANVWMATL